MNLYLLSAKLIFPAQGDMPMQHLKTLLAPYTIELRRHQGKTLRMRVNMRDKLLLVNAPRFVTSQEIERYIQNNMDKIHAHIKHQERALDAQKTRVPRVNPTDFALEVQTLMTHWSALLNLPLPTFFIRRMRSRWGSCTPKTQRIRINEALRFHPLYALEYVVVHELVHILEASHNARFYALLERHHSSWRDGHCYLKQQRLV